jgi:rhodanese-related sulfurtransferase
MKKIAIITVGIVLLASCSEAQTNSGSVAEETVNTEQTQVINKVVAPDEFKELMNKENAQVVDVRTPGEYSGGYIGEAVNIDYMGADFKTEIAKLDMSKPTLIYCAAGGRSGKAAAIMKDLGFTEVYDLRDGYNGWPHK